MSLYVYLADPGRLRQGRAESDQPVKVTVFRHYWNVPIFGGADRIRKLSDQYCAIYSDSAPEGAAALLVVPIDSLDDFGKPVVGEPTHAYGVVAPGRAIALHVDDELHAGARPHPDAVGAFLTA